MLVHSLSESGIAALVVAFCLVQLAFLEVPLLGYAVSPQRTEDRVAAFRQWIDANGLRMAFRLAAVPVLRLIVSGVITLL